eukprot:2504306-Rhodomonas_salina.1
MAADMIGHDPRGGEGAGQGLVVAHGRVRLQREQVRLLARARRAPSALGQQSDGGLLSRTGAPGTGSSAEVLTDADAGGASSELGEAAAEAAAGESRQGEAGEEVREDGGDQGGAVEDEGGGGHDVLDGLLGPAALIEDDGAELIEERRGEPERGKAVDALHSAVAARQHPPRQHQEEGGDCKTDDKLGGAAGEDQGHKRREDELAKDLHDLPVPGAASHVHSQPHASPTMSEQRVTLVCEQTAGVAAHVQN